MKTNKTHEKLIENVAQNYANMCAMLNEPVDLDEARKLAKEALER